MLIYMADTGLLWDRRTLDPTATPLPAPVVTEGRSRRRDADPAFPTPGGAEPAGDPRYTGHGTFVAGVTRCMAPAAEIIVANAFSVAGSVLEADLVPGSKQRLASAWTSSI